MSVTFRKPNLFEVSVKTTHDRDIQTTDFSKVPVKTTQVRDIQTTDCF